MPGREASAQSLAARPTASQPSTASAGTPRRVGVVLSGGGAKGFAHIGVLRELEARGIRIDAITGTSMGGILAGLYAVGHDPDALERIAVDQDWSGLFSDRPSRRLIDLEGRALPERELLAFPIHGGRLTLPTGLVSDQRISQLLSQLTWSARGVDDFSRLPTPFAAVATDLETGEAVVLKEGSLPLALRATMSIPGLFRPVSIGGRLLVDGGLARNLPAQDARTLGAETLICSDVSDPLYESKDLQSLLDILLQTTSFQMTASTEAQRDLCDVLIQPDIAGLSTLDFDVAAPWIARGEAAARDALERLGEASGLPPLGAEAPSPASPGPRPRPTAAELAPPEKVTYAGIEFPNTSEEAAELARAAMQLPDSGTTAYDDLVAAVRRVYDTGLFDQVSYRLDTTTADAAPRLLVDLTEATADAVSFGFRYDTHYKASLQFGAHMAHWLRYGSSTRIDLRLGEQLQIAARHLQRNALESRLVLGADASYSRTPLEIFARGEPIAEVRSEVTNVSGFLGVRLGDSTLARLQVKGEQAATTTTIGTLDVPDAGVYYTVGASIWRDTRDRPYFTRRGTVVFVDAETASDRIGSGSNFSQAIVDLRASIPVRSHLTLHVRGLAGGSTGPGLPLHYRFFLGGWNTSAIYSHRHPVFFGLDTQALSGGAVQLLQTGLQYELRDGIFGTVWGNVGATGDEWHLDLGPYVTGVGLSLGTDSVIGPIQFSIGGRSFAKLSRVEVNLGYRF